MTEALRDSPTWLPILVAGIPAAASIIAAIFAGAYAKKARMAEADAAHMRELEARIASTKYDVYKPMIEMLRDALDPQSLESVSEDDMRVKTADFSTWISIFGSDEAVRSFHRFMQGAYSNAPGLVAIRLYAEFVLAARKDMGYSDTSISSLDVLGIRIKDIYNNRNNYDPATLPFERLCRKYNWSPPWSRDPKDMPETSGEREED